MHMNPGGGIKVWDTFGWHGDNYNHIIAALLSGKIKDNFQEGEFFDMSDAYFPTTIADEVHSVACLIPLKYVGNVRYLKRF